MENNYNNLYLDQLFFRADNEIKDGFITEAMNTLMEIIEQDAEYGKAYNHLGWIYETKYKNYPKAEECYKLALKFASDYTAVYLNYAILLSTLERFEDLEPLLEKAMNVQGINKSKIWNEYAIMYELQAKFQKAIDAYKKSMQYSLDNADIERFEQSIQRCEKKQKQLGFGMN